MTRPDLRALASGFLTDHDPADPNRPTTLRTAIIFNTADLTAFAAKVAAHERARIVAKLREKARSRESAMEDLVLWQFADELEDET